MKLSIFATILCGVLLNAVAQLFIKAGTKSFADLNLIENGLTLYSEEGINGLEFPVGNRAIDILAIDKSKNYVVIELKVSRGYDRVVGQILRYMAWIRKYNADKNQKVRGIIIAREITEDLILACSETQSVDLFEYSLSVSLKKVEKPDK